MIRFLFVLFFTGLFSWISAAPGDTNIIRVHDKTHWYWYGSKIDTGAFPDGSTTYAKILLKYTMGCPSGGCSDWDYTTQILLRERINDTTVINHEMAKIITPYGGYLSNSWEHSWYFDVTDLTPLLQDSVEINAHYSGWQDGFTVTTDFIFIEGTPPREVLRNTTLAHGSFKYGDASHPNSCENQTAPKPYDLLPNAKTFKIKARPTGHGFNGNGYDPGNPDNCAEFCDKWFKLSVDGTEHFQTQIWRDDCGVNPLFRQNGTWIYNRAGWCPGDVGTLHEYDVTDLLTPGQTHDIGFTWEPYSNTSPNNSNYIFHAQLVEYGDYNFQHDVEIIEIGVPSTNENYARQNPACSNPLIVIRNNGEQTLNELDIEYGLKGLDNTITYRWTGSLASGESIPVEIPTNGWLLQQANSDVFHVRLHSPNGQEDESKWNNYMESEFERVPKESGVYVWLKTNNYPQENTYAIYNDAGAKVYEQTNLPVNTAIRDTFDLPDGCYTFVMTDSDCDGLSFPFNNPPYVPSGSAEGVGYIMFWRSVGSGQITNLEPNFGCETSFRFAIGQGYTGDTPEFTNVKKESPILFQNVYPNPTDEEVWVELALQNTAPVTLSLFDLTGRKVASQMVNGDFIQESVSVTDLPSGIYLLTISQEGEQLATEKVLVR